MWFYKGSMSISLVRKFLYRTKFCQAKASFNIWLNPKPINKTGKKLMMPNYARCTWHSGHITFDDNFLPR